VVNDALRRLETEEQAERFYRARRRGGQCAACGRELAKDEPVFIERFEDARGRWNTRATGPVGAECASTWLRRDAMDREPEHCAGCLRPMYYGVDHARRGRALCSQGCRHRALKRRQAGG
jgi:hypothetical protein